MRKLFIPDPYLLFCILMNNLEQMGPTEIIGLAARLLSHQGSCS